MNSLKVTPIQTPIYRENVNLLEFIWLHSKHLLQEGTVLAITSKLYSISEKRFVDPKSISKRELIEQEADHVLCETQFGVVLTLKDGLVLPSAGIDESNSEHGNYLLYPKDPYQCARETWRYLREKSGIKNLGIIITDSHTTPLRKGVIGVGLSHYGFAPVQSKVGDEDLFGRKLKMTAVNVLDALSVAAVLMMGESSECQPLALIQLDGITFTESGSPKETQIPLEEDLYGPLLKAFMK